MMLSILLFAPLLSAACIALLTRRSPRLSAGIALTAVGISFFLSTQFFGKPLVALSWPWLQVAETTFGFGYWLDGLGQLMLLVVTGVSLCVHIYSLGYMRGDASFSRYFAGLSLFTFAMLGVVLADNFVMLFMFWELVGLASYALIGFWFEKPSASAAANKAFIVNRFADFGFMLGIILLCGLLGTVNFAEIRSQLPSLASYGPLTTVAALLIFCGAVGKSAQFPLHIWLPDAMEGPTPVSALIHAATMVAAGVYMLARLSWFFAVSPEALHIIAWVGGFTAIFAAVIAILQNDIKRILAYSTLSQLGYMVMAVGLGGSVEAIFHLTTHAFFKALLFLGAGSVILATHHEQDIWKMGGLRKQTPITFVTFAIGTLALAGIWPLSGFFSKDAILLLAFHHNTALFVIAWLTAGLTAFYMGRLVWVVFFGKAKTKAHESPLVMTLPMVVLAALSITSGWFDKIPHAIDIAYDSAHPSWAPLLIVMPLLGLGLSALLYLRGPRSDALLTRVLSRPVSRAIQNKFYVDEIYAAVFGALETLFGLVTSFVETQVIGRFNSLAVISSQNSAQTLRKLQAASVRSYIFMFAAGVALAFYWITVLP